MSQGATIWLTGLSGAGKTTISRMAAERLVQRGIRTEILDGDEVRKVLTADLGFSREDRVQNARKVAYVAKLLSRNGVVVFVSLISPYREMRDHARREMDRFLEVYVKCSLAECARRDVKGLYQKAVRGQIPRFTGISDPFEEPEHPDLVLDTERETPQESAAKLLRFLEAKGWLAPERD